MALVVVSNDDLVRGRTTLRRLLMAGQRSLHVRKEGDRRRRALDLVIERDDSVVERDRQVLFAHLARHDEDGCIRYRHVGRHEEPLMWIADAVAWSVARGGEWRRRVSGRVIETRVRGWTR